MDATLVQYGALGVLAIASMTIAGILWRRLDSERTQRDADAKAHAAEVKVMLTTHQGQLTALLERIIEDGQTMASDYHTIADRSTVALEAIARRFDRAPTRKG